MNGIDDPLLHEVRELIGGRQAGSIPERGIRPAGYAAAFAIPRVMKPANFGAPFM